MMMMLFITKIPKTGRILIPLGLIFTILVLSNSNYFIRYLACHGILWLDSLDCEVKIEQDKNHIMNSFNAYEQHARILSININMTLPKKLELYLSIEDEKNRILNLFGTERLSRGLISSGNSTLLKRLFTKAINGESLEFLLIGGSHAAGEGLATPDEVFISHVASWFENTFHINVTILNLAIGATGSDYFALCGSAHMKQGVDLVIGEHAVNDDDSQCPSCGLKPYFPFQATVSEQLMLQVDDTLFVYAAFTRGKRKFHSGQDLPDVLSTYIDHGATVVSLRDALFGNNNETVNTTNNPKHFDWDALYPSNAHVQKLGHQYLGDLIIFSFLNSLEIFLENKMIDSKIKTRIYNDKNVGMGGVKFVCIGTTLSPRVGSFLIPSTTTTLSTNGTLSTNVTLSNNGTIRLPINLSNSNEIQETIPKILPYVSGWDVREVTLLGKSESQRFTSRKNSNNRIDRKFMWYKNSTNEDDIIMFNIEVVTGNIGIAWFTGPNFGTANVWIDNDRNNSIKNLVVMQNFG